MDGTFEGRVSLTVVDGGLSDAALSPELVVANPVEAPAHPIAKAPSFSGRAFVEAACEHWDLPAWEVVALCERAVAALGRDLDEEEADRFVMWNLHRRQMDEDFRRTLAGFAVVLPTNAQGDDFGCCDLDDAQFLAEIKDSFEEARHRKAG